MLNFLKSMFLSTRRTARVRSIDDLSGHYFKYWDPDTHKLLMEVWVQEPNEQGHYELITTHFGADGGYDSSMFIDSTGMIRNDPEIKGRPTCHWLPPRLRQAGLVGNMGIYGTPVTIATTATFRGLKVWHVQHETCGMAASIYYDLTTGVKVGQTSCGVLAKTSLNMRLPEL